jgi:hypothetical protein
MMKAINDLIAQAEQAKQAEQEENERLSELRKKEQFDELTAKLPPEWKELEPHMQLEVEPKGNSYFVYHWSFGTFEKCKELELAPINLYLSNHGYITSGFKVYGYHDGNSNVIGIQKIADALLHARANYPKYKKERIEELADDILKGLNFVWNRKDNDLEAARLAHARLLALDPEQKERWDMRLRSFEKSMADKEEQDRQSKARADEFEKQTAQYKADYLAFVDEKSKALEHNQRIALDIQPEFDEAYTVYQLTYGVAAIDEDGERFAETRHVWLSQKEKNEKGEFVLITGSAIKYIHPVSIQEFVYRPSMNQVGSLYVSMAGIRISCRMDRREELENAMKAAKLFDIPQDPPEEPHHLSTGEAREIRREIENQYMGVPTSDEFVDY